MPVILLEIVFLPCTDAYHGPRPESVRVSEPCLCAPPAYGPPGDPGYRGISQLLSHFPLPADSCTSGCHHLHVVLVFNALLQRGNSI